MTTARDYNKTSGDTFTLRGPREVGFSLMAPDGSTWKSPAKNGRVTVWVPVAGTWFYEWLTPGGPFGSIYVEDPVVVVEPDVAAPVSVPTPPQFDLGRIEVS